MIEFRQVHDQTASDDLLPLLAPIERLHRQLRPRIPKDYFAYLHAMIQEGARLVVLTDADQPRALAVWRIQLTTYQGKRFYVDDLVTDESVRGSGWGGQLLDWLEEQARAQHCDSFALDSGVQRDAAHRFYFRAGLVIASFSFVKRLSDRF